ncbi:MAG: hypothetical protein U0871_20605 [Gemmataceae bacterium]
MRAVVVVSGRSGDGFGLADPHPLTMVWLVDRPLVQWVCETLADAGVRTVDWVHHRAGDGPRQLLGSGRRWGARYRHHTADPLGSPYPLVRTLVASGDAGAGVLVGHADRVPPAALGSADAAVRLYDESGGHGWTGWAAISGPAVGQFPGQAATPATVESALAGNRAGPCERVAVPAGLPIRCLSSYLAATRAALGAAGTAPVWVSPSARVHPTARLIGPVRLGPRAEVGRGATVGPNAVVGPDCVLDRDVQLANAVVLPDTFVGGRLRLDGGVVGPDRVLTPGPGGAVRVADRVPVTSLTAPPFGPAWPASLSGGAMRLVRLFRTVPARLLRPADRRTGPQTAAPMPAASY